MKPPRKDPVLAAVTDGWSTTPEVARRATAHERDHITCLAHEGEDLTRRLEALEREGLVESRWSHASRYPYWRRVRRTAEAFGVLLATLVFLACEKSETAQHLLARRMAHMDAIKALVQVACPCGVATLEVDTHHGGGEVHLDALSCHPCDGLLVPVTTAPLGRLETKFDQIWRSR